METTLGAALLVLYALLVPLLWRLVRPRTRPPWLRRGLNAEYLMLAHIALLIAGIMLVAVGQGA